MVFDDGIEPGHELVDQSDRMTFPRAASLCFMAARLGLKLAPLRTAMWATLRTAERPPPDRAATLECAALPIIGGDPDKGGDLAMGEAAQFGQMGQKCPA